jgi:peptidoglycan/xylan/chitin deacetylase (PgdA/CDA1 family)
MEWLKSHCHIVSLPDLALGKNLDPKKLNIGLSFDDGFKEYATFVAPVLTELSIPATFFTPSGALDISGEAAARFSKDGLRRSTTFEFMTRDELRELSQNPLFIIGGHTMHHKDVATLDSKGLNEEIIEDKNALEQITGKPVEWFAYPFGSIANISAEAIRTIDKSGYIHAFSILPSFWKKKDHPYLVGRDSLSVLDSDELWDSWLKGGYDTMTALKQYARRQTLMAQLKNYISFP